MEKVKGRRDVNVCWENLTSYGECIKHRSWRILHPDLSSDYGFSTTNDIRYSLRKCRVYFLHEYRETVLIRTSFVIIFNF